MQSTKEAKAFKFGEAFNEIWTVIDTKPSENHEGCRVCLVGREHSHGKEFATGVYSARSLEFKEWSWGHYFRDILEAAQDYTGRK